MSCGPERVAAVLNHTNRKGQTALILACAHGCVNTGAGLRARRRAGRARGAPVVAAGARPRTAL